MITNALMLLICYLLFKYTTSWIKYYNQLDERMPDSLWRYTCDYPVVGIRDISDLDDKPFVRLRRKRNRAVTFMYFIFFLSFVIFMSFLNQILLRILH